MPKKKSGKDGELEELVALLERESPIERLEPHLAALADPSGLARAKAALQRVKKGLRRQFLALRVAEQEGASAQAADLAHAFCVAFAALEGDRLALGAALCHAANMVSNPEVVRAALANLAKVDPYYTDMLPIAVHNAEARGDATEAAMLRARAETVLRLRPILRSLVKDTEAGAKKSALAAVAALSSEDRGALDRRVAHRPELFDEEVVVPALAATIDVPEVSSVSFLWALSQVGDDDEETDVSKALSARLAEDEALVTALARRVIEADAHPRATSDDDLDEDFIYEGTCCALFALAEHADEPAVVSLVTDALRAGKEKLRLTRAVALTIFHGLHAAPKAWRVMSDALAREGFTFLVAAAREGAFKSDAESALFYWNRPGIEDLLARAMDEEKDYEVLENLYSAARHIEARELLIERLPKEKREFWRLQDAIGDVWTPAFHEQILDRLDAWRDPRVAEIYLEALLDKNRRALVLELARVVLGWKTPSDKSARYAKRVFIEGARAALDAHDYAFARSLWDQAQAIKGDSLSNEHVTEREGKAPDPFQDKEAKKRLKMLLSGELEKSAAREREKIAAARASGKPRKASDELLGSLAGGAVELRLFEDEATREVLFVDVEEGLRYYDGYAVAPLLWAIEPLGAMRAATAFDARALAWDKAGARYIEIARFGDRVAVHFGLNNDYKPRGFVASGALYEKMRAHPPKGFTYGSPFFAEGRGGVAREYVLPDDTSEIQAVVGARWDRGRRRFPSHEEAARAYEAWEIDLYGRGACLKNLEWMKRLQRDEDMSLRQWIEERARDDEQSLRWHVEALAELEVTLRAQGVWPSNAEITIGPAASADDIAAFEATVEIVPEVVRSLWTSVGRASWKVGARGERVLGPREALELRPRLFAWIEEEARKRGKGFEASLRDCHPLIVDEADRPSVVVRCTRAAGSSFVASIDAEPAKHAWWCDALAWEIATRFTPDFVAALADADPAIHYLRYGERASAVRSHVSLTNGDSVWIAVLDEDTPMLIVAKGKRGRVLKVTRKSEKDVSAARKAFDAAVRAQKSTGFRPS